MEPELERGARHLLETRAAVNRLKDLPIECRPRTLTQAYRMQAEVTKHWADEVAGWKVGATSKEVQRLFGVTEPVYGPVFTTTIFDSPARLGGSAFQHRMLETEFAFRLGDDLTPRTKPYGRGEVLDAVDVLIPAIEIVSPRFERLRTDDIPQLVADFCANGGAVFGQPRSDWRSLDLRSHPVTLFIGGNLRQKGTGALVLDDPVNVLEWFVNTINAAGRGIKRGQFVMTGTMTGIHAPDPGETAVADFGRLGTVEVLFV